MQYRRKHTWNRFTYFAVHKLPDLADVRLRGCFIARTNERCLSAYNRIAFRIDQQLGNSISIYSDMNVIFAEYKHKTGSQGYCEE